MSCGAQCGHSVPSWNWAVTHCLSSWVTGMAALPGGMVHGQRLITLPDSDQTRCRRGKSTVLTARQMQTPSEAERGREWGRVWLPRAPSSCGGLPSRPVWLECLDPRLPPFWVPGEASLCPGTFTSATFCSQHGCPSVCWCPPPSWVPALLPKLLGKGLWGLACPALHFKGCKTPVSTWSSLHSCLVLASC